LALAEIQRKGEALNVENLLQHEIVSSYNPDEIQSEVTQFIRRRVLIEKNGILLFTVGFFKDWLLTSGFREIMTTFSDLDKILKRKQKEEEAFITSEEISKVVQKWGHFKGQKKSEDSVRMWLNQFGNNVNQRLMFKILSNIHFYSASRIRAKLMEGHGIISRGLTQKIGLKKRKRNDILVSYLDSPGKSGGGIYAKLYADENNIYVKNVIEKNRIEDFIHKHEGLKALVFIDDFIGTGESIMAGFSELNELCGNILKEINLKIYFIAICGFQEKKIKIEKLLDEIGLLANLHICDPLDEGDKCFSESSRYFENLDEKKQAEQLAYEYGAKLVRKNYLGYGDCQTAVIFEYNCPNNNLPILWAESENPQWTPLFKR